MPLDPGTAALLELIDSSGYPPMHEGTPETARRAFRAMTCDLVTPDTAVAVGSVEELAVADLPARLYRPEGAGPFPTLLFLHGGGFVIGDLDTHDQTCRRICRGAEVVVLAIDYRLAPESPYPAAVDDALAAAGWAADHLAELGGDARFGVGGDSASGNLSAIVAQTMRDVVTGQVLIYPATHMGGDHASRVDNADGYFLDLTTMLWFLTHYAGPASDVDDPRLSPFTGPVRGTAPALVVTAEFDPLRDEGEAYAALLGEAGVPVETVRYDGLVHGFIDMGPMSVAAADAVDDTVSRIRTLLHG